ncbi:DUF4034 domain-containing protein, partial [Salmonella enterica subsp. enterica serovar Kentucky]|nr:DUF4034 domain-containing protein [Salmonella enterica subsp. enterica serovar Kentucky]
QAAEPDNEDAHYYLCKQRLLCGEGESLLADLCDFWQRYPSTQREAEKRYFFAWNQMDNPFYDMDTLVEAGPQGLALIKNWQRAR